jgi:L-2-hydroxyglutarate oxidase LhgO
MRGFRRRRRIPEVSNIRAAIDVPVDPAPVCAHGKCVAGDIAIGARMCGAICARVGQGNCMVESVETIVVGAGVVGLAIAWRLAHQGQEVLVLESERRIGTQTSSRNSEVIHAGLYYPPGSLKARLCVEGRGLLYEFCASFHVPHRRIGKFIVATNEAEQSKLAEIARIAERNGVTDLAPMSGREVEAEEPEVSCLAALYSPSTGIVDSGALMLSLQGALESWLGAISLNTQFVSARVAAGKRIAVSAASEDGIVELNCRNLVNAAGHGAHAVAAAFADYPVLDLPPRFFAKGNYYSVSGRSPFLRLIYPVPVPGALGTHVTLDLQGNVRLGPDIEWVDQLEYSVQQDIGLVFAASRKFWPDVGKRSLAPSYCGVRPKIHGPGESFADFRIDGPRHHGVPGLINLFGIESPGLTSSLAIARYVGAMLASDEAA